MPSLGTKIRQERERQGLALDQIAAETRIRLAYLQAIESDRLEVIPGGFFSRSFVRQYAAFLKMDARQVELELEAMTPKPVDTVRVDKVLTDYRPTTGPVLGMGPDGEESEFTTDSSYLREPKTGMPWIAFAALLILGSVGFLTWQRRPELVALRAPTPGAQSVTSPRPSPSSAPPGTLSSARATTPAEPTPVEDPSVAPRSGPGPAPQALASTIAFRVSAASDAWIEVTVDRKRAFTGVLSGGTSRAWSGAGEARILTGNAGALTVEFNGKDIGAVGPPGMVRTILLSPAGAEIRAATPTRGPAGNQPLAAAPAPGQ